MVSAILKEDNLSYPPSKFKFSTYQVKGANENSTVNPRNNFLLEFNGTFPITINYDKIVETTTKDINVKDQSTANATFSIVTNDTYLISNILPNTQNPDVLFTEYIKKLNDQNKQQNVESTIENSNVSVSANQVHNAIEYM